MIILLCIRWCCKYQLSYRDLEEMMRECGLAVDHTTIFRWVRFRRLSADTPVQPDVTMGQLIKSKIYALITVTAIFAGFTGGIMSAHLTTEGAENKSNVPLKEITLSREHGLLFKLEDGTPIVKMGKIKAASI
jgi:hypothetical protein